MEPGKVIFEGKLEATPDDVYTQSFVETGSIVLKEGETYSVTTDSGTFSAVCKKIERDGALFYILGNMGPVGVLTDESFTFGSIYENEIYGIIALDYAGGTHMKVELPETIHPIDQKYLPDSVMPKEIDLTEYEFVATDGATTSLNDAVLLAFMDQGEIKSTNASAFWSDASTKRPIRCKIAYTNNTVLYYDINVRVCDKADTLWQVLFDVVVVSEGTVHRGTMILARESDDTITVTFAP